MNISYPPRTRRFPKEKSQLAPLSLSAIHTVPSIYVRTHAKYLAHTLPPKPSSTPPTPHPQRTKPTMSSLPPPPASLEINMFNWYSATALAYAANEHKHTRACGRLAIWIDGSVTHVRSATGFAYQQVVDFETGAREWLTRGVRHASDGAASPEAAEFWGVGYALRDIALPILEEDPVNGDGVTAVAVYTDSMWVAKKLSQVEGKDRSTWAWADEGLRQVYRDIELLAERFGVRVEVNWVPGHSGVDGNELANYVAQSTTGASTQNMGARALVQRKRMEDLVRQRDVRMRAGEDRRRQQREQRLRDCKFIFLCQFPFRKEITSSAVLKCGERIIRVLVGQLRKSLGQEPLAGKDYAHMQLRPGTDRTMEIGPNFRVQLSGFSLLSLTITTPQSHSGEDKLFSFPTNFRHACKHANILSSIPSHAMQKLTPFLPTHPPSLYKQQRRQPLKHG